MPAQLIHQTHSPFKIELYQFDFGLHLLYHPDHNAPLLSYQTWVNVGSRHEPQGKTGLAHLFEHLMFKATQTHAEGEFDRRLEEMGGHVNAGTWLDWTYFYNDIPSRFLSEVIELEADRFSNLLLNSEQLETERKVVMNERRECVDDQPESLLDEQLWALAFGKEHPYGHPTIGWMDDIQELSLETCQLFYQKYYHPEYLTLVVCGDVDRDELIQKVDQSYRFQQKGEKKETSNLSSSILSPPPFSKSVNQGPLHQDHFLDLYQPKMILGWRMPSVLDRYSVVLDVLNEILFDGESSRLHQELIDQKEWINQIYGWVPSFYSEGLYQVQVEVRQGVDLKAIHATILNGIQKVADEGVEEVELVKAKNRLEIEVYRGMQTMQQRAYSLGFWQSVSGDYQNLFSRPQLLNEVSIQDLKAVAQLLTDTTRQFSVYGFPHDQAS